MKNIFFPDESITEDDLYFMCYITERIARTLHQHNCYVVNKELVDIIPTEIQMGKVYCRLILQTLEENGDYVQGMLRIYNSWIVEELDNYNTGVFYEPSYILKRAYYANSFNGL